MTTEEIKGTESTATVNVSDVKAGEQVVVGTDAASQAAAEKSNDNPMGEGDKAQMPEGGHEKYWDADKAEYNWEAHARELAWQNEQKTGQEERQETAEKLQETDKVAEQAAEKAGVNLDEFNAYVAENGKVNPEHLKSFEAAGIPPEAVEEYVALKIQAVENQYEAVVEYFGGAAAKDQLNQFLVKNFTRDEVVEFNNQLMNPAKWRATAAFLMGEAGMARPGRGLIKGDNQQGGAAAQGEQFATEAEFNAAMRDPRYKVDPAYRTRVQNTLRNSPHLL
jgi:hypothetical protein